MSNVTSTRFRGLTVRRLQAVRPRTPEEVAFLALGEGARRWLAEAARPA